MRKRRTHDDFIKEVYDLVGDEYSVLSQFSNVDTKVTMEHAKCNHKYEVTPYHFINRGNRCPECFGNKKRTTESYKKEIYELVGNEYSVEGEYKTNRIKVDMKHNECDYVWGVTPTNFLRGTRCPICAVGKRADKRRKPHEQFLTELHELVGDEYEICDGETYANSTTKLKAVHKGCNREFDMCPADFLQGTRCPKCAFDKFMQTPRNMYKTTDTFKREVFELYGDEYEVKEDYTGCNEGIAMHHVVCEHTYETKPSYFLSGGGRCPKCFGYSRKTTEIFKEEVFNLEGENYSVLGEYIKDSIHILMKHNKCSHEWNIAPTSFLQGVRCPKCRESKGERRIGDFLELKGIQYERQFRFIDCANERPLPFDFAIVLSDKVKALIEYDGMQHFKPVEFFGGEEGFAYRKRNDQIKNTYCAENDIPLIRIPYWEQNNIDNILEVELENINLH